MKIVLIRHGLTDGNLEKRYIGSTDEPLCRDGIEAIRKNVSSGKYPAADLVFVSPMKRCLQTAELIYGKREFIVISEFKEMDFGQFEGRNYQELNGNPDYQKWIDSGGTLAFPGGEDRQHFIERTMLGFEKMMKTAESCTATVSTVSPSKKIDELTGKSCDNKTVTLVCHGGTIMSVLSSFGIGDYYDFKVKNGEGFILEPEVKKCYTI